MTATLRETRHTSILWKRVKLKVEREGREGIDQASLDLLRHRSVRELFRLALARPFRFLTTEAIVVFGALYNGYLYGLSFLFNEAFTLVFGPEGHGFGIIGVGLAFLGIIIGISLGPLTNIWQDRYYLRCIAGKPGANIPEARVQLGKMAAMGTMFDEDGSWEVNALTS